MLHNLFQIFDGSMSGGMYSRDNFFCNPEHRTISVCTVDSGFYRIHSADPDFRRFYRVYRRRVSDPDRESAESSDFYYYFFGGSAD